MSSEVSSIISSFSKFQQIYATQLPCIKVILNIPQCHVYSCSQIPFSRIIATNLLSNSFVVRMVSVMLSSHVKIWCMRGLIHVCFMRRWKDSSFQLPPEKRFSELLGIPQKLKSVLQTSLREVSQALLSLYFIYIYIGSNN